MTDPQNVWRRAALALVLAAAAVTAPAQQRVRNGDYIVAIVNQEAVTAAEVEARLQRELQQAARAGGQAPAVDAVRKRVLDELIEERVIVTYARDSGMRVEEPELDRAVQSVAAQNQISADQLRARLRSEGIDYARFRANLRDQIMIERVREREVYQRIRITDGEVDRYLADQKIETQADIELNLAQILVSVPEGGDDTVVAARKARAERALARVRAGEDFATVAREISEDANKERGGVIGLRPAARLPDLFVDAVRDVAAGETKTELVRSGAGFHVIKVLERKETSALRVTQTHARHILVRSSEQVSPEVATRRLSDFRRQIESGQRRFEDIARQYSEDGSAPSGGDLGWFSPGTMVPEFEDAMNKLPIGGVSEPVVSRFGVHLIQVVERRDIAVEARQVRDQARNVLRERKFDDAYSEWAKDLRDRAYIEMREPPI
ncbi:molecular chaperone SurA [Rubrivivax gelatinosus]|uniref:peptidylprolyl isomerase n=1 Tax=Rubrivivax gelatinosus TaxID=28068 RepID=UPI0019057884|nr:peptidylprolyl isomerase [Rubrivivax gelatinosus]MBK1612874.1 molecular chaperone SurA [Rubrivivax gelatinosus]